MPPVVVFDTNILFSWAGWQGNPYRCVELARTGAVRHITCQEILVELTEKLETKLNFSEEQITKTMLDLIEFADIIRITGMLKVVADDPDDDAVIECAVVGQANFIVSGDRHLLSIGNYQGIEIVKASELFARLAGKNGMTTVVEY